MIHHLDRSNDVTKAVRVLRRNGVPVGFPMQTANGEIIFAIGKDFTITADQVLELLDLGELHAEGVRRLAQAHGRMVDPRRLHSIHRRLPRSRKGA